MPAGVRTLTVLTVRGEAAGSTAVSSLLPDEGILVGDDGGMPVDVTTEIVIERPCEQVAAYAGDPSHAPEWYANINSVRWQTPPPVGVGSRMDFVARFLGRTLAYTYE